MSIISNWINNFKKKKFLKKFFWVVVERWINLKKQIVFAFLGTVVAYLYHQPYFFEKSSVFCISFPNPPWFTYVYICTWKLFIASNCVNTCIFIYIYSICTIYYCIYQQFFFIYIISFFQQLLCGVTPVSGPNQSSIA